VAETPGLTVAQQLSCRSFKHQFARDGCHVHFGAGTDWPHRVPAADASRTWAVLTLL
jgi:hypothetical protein